LTIVVTYVNGWDKETTRKADCSKQTAARKERYPPDRNQWKSQAADFIAAALSIKDAADEEQSPKALIRECR
jgi:hypothetical protein